MVDQAKKVETASCAFKKNNEELVQAFNKAISDMYTDGSYSRISSKWFGSDISESHR
ncbi:transporter substrate-binding domain-containing protein [Paenibacillus chartarius]|uniref:Transporter substrate-binding domain-containing protein n=1 Tax=Paenibacillus chartarius TaxID=747481 RepID=A0ABV6DUQ9_9BACL